MNKRNVLRHLKRAVKYINDGWCTGCLAKDINGDSVDPESSRAVFWCAAGALYASSNKTDFEVEDARSALKECLPRGKKNYGLGAFNDSCIFKKDVIKLFNKAISKLERYDVK